MTLGAGCGGGGSAVEEQQTTESSLAFSSPTAGDATPSASSDLTMTVTWVAPTLNEDGSVLTDLRGYVVLVGSQRDIYDRAIPVDDPKATQHSVEGLSAGLYYVAVKAVNRDGVESMAFAEVAQRIQ